MSSKVFYYWLIWLNSLCFLFKGYSWTFSIFLSNHHRLLNVSLRLILVFVQVCHLDVLFNKFQHLKFLSNYMDFLWSYLMAGSYGTFYNRYHSTVSVMMGVILRVFWQVI